MKLGKKFFALLTATIFALSFLTGLAMADEVAHTFPNSQIEQHSDGNQAKIAFPGNDYSDINQVRLTFTGDVDNFHLQFVINSDNKLGGWDETGDQGDLSLADGNYVRTVDVAEKHRGEGDWFEAVVNLWYKNEGALQLASVEFLDDDGEVIETVGTAPAAEAPADNGDADTDDGEDAGKAPAEGIVSSALFLGLGAVALGTGAIVLKKKEDE